jgi:hypothetical protein
MWEARRGARLSRRRCRAALRFGHAPGAGAPTGLARLAHLPQNCWGRSGPVRSDWPRAVGRQIPQSAPSCCYGDAWERRLLRNDRPLRLKPCSCRASARDRACRSPSGGFSRCGGAAPARPGHTNTNARTARCAIRAFVHPASCPSRARTWTFLIQSQACCQLHQGAVPNQTDPRPTESAHSRTRTWDPLINSQML